MRRPIADGIPAAHTPDRYALSFVQNFVVLRSLWISGLGLLMLLALPFTPRPEAGSTVAAHLVAAFGLAAVLGVRDARRRLALAERFDDDYARLGERYYQLRGNGVMHARDLAFSYDVLRTFVRTGALGSSALAALVLVAVSVAPVLVVGDAGARLFRQDFQYAFYPFSLSLAALTVYRIVRFLYWRSRIASVIRERYGYEYRDLAQMAARP